VRSALLLSLLLVAPAHVPARVRLAAPAEDARVVGTAVRIVLVGEGGTAAATFRLELDGRPVGADGTVGGLFTTLRVGAQSQETITVDGVAPGEHVIRMTPEADPAADSSAPVVVRRFRVVADEKGGGAAPLALLGVVAAVAVGAAVAVRRRAGVAPADAPE
jgi:hypothetical protein